MASNKALRSPKEGPCPLREPDLSCHPSPASDTPPPNFENLEHSDTTKSNRYSKEVRKSAPSQRQEKAALEGGGEAAFVDMYVTEMKAKPTLQRRDEC